MVRLSLAKLGGHNYKVKGLKLPGLDGPTLKKYPAVLPIHIFTSAGVLFASWYIYRLIAVPDTIVNKYKTPAYMTKATKMSFIQPGMDYKKLELPKEMPNVYD